MRKLVTTLLARATKRIASKYIAGPDIEDAIRICRRINQHGWRSTICPWDSPGEKPESVVSSYRKALYAISGEELDCYLSIKAPSLQYDFALLKELLDIASEHRIRVHFDALGPDTATPSFALLEKVAQSYNNLGCTLPSRWKRSAADARRAIELRVAVRVVKGQWPDPDQPAVDPRVSFLKLIDLLAGRAEKVAVASHDVPLASESLARLIKGGTPCELEQLFGLPLRVDRVAQPRGLGIRLYVPYGTSYLPYALSEIKKRPVILTWLLKDLFADTSQLQRFLKSPSKLFNHQRTCRLHEGGREEVLQ